jgi:hypothetical protein
VSATEQWKLRFGDEIDRQVDVTERMRVEVVGDDLAGEGTDRALDVYPGRYTIDWLRG